MIKHCEVLIIGAGLCGLSTAYHLEHGGCEDYLLLERQDRVGGLARTEAYDGFSFDHSIHILYTRDQYAAQFIACLLEGNLRRQNRESYCYTAGVYTEYPYQANNHGLPVDIIVENIIGLIEAHRAEADQSEGSAHFEEWIYRTFGYGIAKNFMIPYNRRQWAWDLRDMKYEWIAERVPMPRVRDVLVGALQPPEKKYGPNREFWYPKEGGIEALAKALASRISMSNVRPGVEVTEINPIRREVTLRTGERVRYGRLVSTVPLPVLVAMLGGVVPAEVRACSKALKHNIVHTVNIGLDGPELPVDRPMHWVYFPEEATTFHRISFPHHFSPWMVPPNCCSIQAEISESKYRPRERATLVEETIKGLVQVGLLRESEARDVSSGGRVRVAEVVTLDPAYVIYDLRHSDNKRVLTDYLKSYAIESRGRFGEWEYFNMDHALLSGKEAARAVLGTEAVRQYATQRVRP